MINNNKPNVIWFMFDSLRNEFLNEFGCEEAERNFVDELVSQGVSFTNCHGTAPFAYLKQHINMVFSLPDLWGLQVLSYAYALLPFHKIRKRAKKFPLHDNRFYYNAKSSKGEPHSFTNLTN